MKYLYTILLTVCVLNISAQTIIDELQANVDSSEGVIRVECSPAIAALIGTPIPSSAENREETITRPGFRVQVFMGSKPGAARAEATSKQNTIKEQFPELPVYMTYNAPNWKLTVGDFTTREEANLVKQQLQRAFPEFGQEMYLVSATIKMYSTASE
ncbi:MAG: SPOR domain-containing protein [Candidatus Symbiothrix sp.]|jgi:hypothetical protein|nr:SPOR domain-containing protein [Candidatus Symbiothrix sp.]